jgi:hypothetical protein
MPGNANVSVATQKHLARVHELPCALCGSHNIEAHHVTEGKTFGKRDKLHFCTIPLCTSCHQGPNGIHGNKNMLRLVNKSELELLSETLEKIYGGMS